MGEMVLYSVRIPKSLKTLMEKHVEKDTHTTVSEFIRETLRMRIMKEMPDAYNQLFVEDIQVESNGKNGNGGMNGKNEKSN